ncbi:MAG TPA: 5-bromo-4-chloroindolyl phosphate hydrolysis family protein, partial [Virgibacillus sp.]
MRALFHFITRSASAVFGAGLIWLISFLTFEQTFLMTSLYSLLGGGITYVAVKELQNFQIIRKNDLSRREYRFIRKNLKEAKHKISRLRRALYRVRSLSQAKQNLEIYQTVR